MSLATNLKHFCGKDFGIKNIGIKHCALMLGCLLAQHSAFARSDRDPILFQPATLSPLDTFRASLSVDRIDGLVESEQRFTAPAFMSFADADTIRARIARLEEKGNFHSPEIAELSQQLGKALQLEGEHGSALEAYDRSFQINRRHEGLSSTTQVSLLRAKIDSYVALGDMDTVDTLQHSMFSMQQHLLADQPVALADASLAVADWDLKYYLQLRQTPVPGGRTDAQQQALAERLGAAFMQYHKALWLLSTAQGDELLERKIAVERKIAALTLMVDRQHQRDVPNTLTKIGQNSIHQARNAHDPALFDHGSAALQRAITYSVAMKEPVLVAERQLELADWYLLMDQHDQARATYATAVASLREAGIAEQQIAAILEPGAPLRDPETALQSDLEQALSDFDGYIDVSFDLNRYGKASNTRVLAGTSYDEQIEEALLREINDGRFRPGFDQGAPLDHTEVTLRYYFAR